MVSKAHGKIRESGGGRGFRRRCRNVPLIEKSRQFFNSLALWPVLFCEQPKNLLVTDSQFSGELLAAASHGVVVGCRKRAQPFDQWIEVVGSVVHTSQASICSVFVLAFM